MSRKKVKKSERAALRDARRNLKLLARAILRATYGAGSSFESRGKWVSVYDADTVQFTFLRLRALEVLGKKARRLS